MAKRKAQRPRPLHSAVTLEASSAPGSRGSLTSQAAVEAAASRKNKGGTRNKRKYIERARTERRRLLAIADDGGRAWQTTSSVSRRTPRLVSSCTRRDETGRWWFHRGKRGGGSRFNGTPSRPARTRWASGAPRRSERLLFDGGRQTQESVRECRRCSDGCLADQTTANKTNRRRRNVTLPLKRIQTVGGRRR